MDEKRLEAIELMLSDFEEVVNLETKMVFHRNESDIRRQLRWTRRNLASAIRATEQLIKAYKELQKKCLNQSYLSGMVIFISAFQAMRSDLTSEDR